MSSRPVPPAFIVAAPRSGSTLLRLVLDAHPEIGCPGESSLPSLAKALEDVWASICADVAGGHVEKPPAEVQRAMRRTLRAPMDYYLKARGKRLYCDKSLDAPDHLVELHRAFPAAKYVLLFRQAFDVVASGLEASPFGFKAFGYAPFVQNSVDNFVAPLVQHWITRARAALDWEARYPDRCLRVRYEDLATTPEQTMAAIFEFLEVAPDAAAIARGLGSAPDAVTAGDAKIAFTTDVHAASIGRGRRIPVKLVPPLMLAEVNELLAGLGYQRVTDDSHAATARPRAGSVTATAEDLKRLRRLMPARLDARTLAGGAQSFAIVGDDHEKAAWHVDATSGVITQSAIADAEITIVGSVGDLVAVLAGDDNAGSMARDGRLRFTGNTGDGRALVPRPVAVLIRALQSRVRGQA